MPKNTPQHFSSLHNHSFLSLLDGCGSVKEYARLAAERQMTGIAITDHGNMSAAFELWKECKKNNVKALFGSELYIAAEKDIVDIGELNTEPLLVDVNGDELTTETEEEIDDETGEDDNEKIKRDAKKLERKRYHQIILIKNETGWKNACKLNYYSFLKKKDLLYDESKGGFYYSPRVKRNFLYELHDGLIATSTCMASEVNRNILAGQIDDAYKLMEEYKKVFGDDFYGEVQINEIPEQKIVNKHILEICDALKIKVVITSDAHYTEDGDAELQDIMISLARKGTIHDEKAFKLHARNLFLHQKEDFTRLAKEFEFEYSENQIDEWLNNTNEIAEKCNFSFNTDKKFPKYFADQNDSKKKLLELCKESLKKYVVKKNFDPDKIKQYTDRLKYELTIINKNGYTDYMLLVWDIMEFCKREKIHRGIGRGSVGASLVAFLLDICGLDPIKYELFFERFVNPEALSTPDIDLDFDSRRRDEIIEYLKNKWGHDSVTRIGNYNTFHIRGALKDINRTLARSFEDVEFICSNKGANIDETLTADEAEKWFQSFENKTDIKSKRIYQWYIDNKDIIEYVKKIYGETRHLSQHAAGVLITPESIYNFIPVNRTGDTLITGFPESSAHKNCSELGLLKLDVLGLETITLIWDTVELIKKTRGIDISEQIEHLDLENQELYEEFAKGDNFLIFQFEAEGISNTVRDSKPVSFEEVSAINSLHRPAALMAGGTQRFIDVGSGKKELEKIHPLVDPIIKSTKGVIAFQEQVTRIINATSGISTGTAELIRKEIMDQKEKYKKEMDFFNEKYVELCVANGIPQERAQYIKEFLLKNSGYSFNASHSFSYSFLAMQTVYLKLYYPEEFYAISLSLNGDEQKFGQYIMDAMKRKIKVTEPTITKSQYDFIPTGEKEIACGFKMLKGFGIKAYEELISKNRSEWKSIIDFLLQPWSKFNKTALEASVKCGALNEFESNMKIAFELVQYHLEHKAGLDKVHGRGEKKGQVKYSREMLEARYAQLQESGLRDYTDKEKNKFWQEITGFNNPFNNPFLDYMNGFSDYGIIPCTSWNEQRPFIYGMVSVKEVAQTKKQKPFWRLTLFDGFGSIKTKIWDNQIRDNPDLASIEEGSIICMELNKDDWGYTYTSNGRFILLN